MIITICSIKGGVGKTTTVVNLAATLGRAGYDVLTVDMDPQSSLTRWFGVGEDPTLGDVLAGRERITSIVYTDDDAGYDLIPSDRRLREFEDETATLERPLRRLVHNHYDICLIDTPPYTSRFTSAGVEFAAGVVIPVDASMAAMETLGDTLELVRQLDSSLLGILVTQVDVRTSNDISVQPHLEEQYGDRVFTTVIRDSVKVRDSHAERRPTVVAYPDNNASKDYKDVALELLARTQSLTNTSDAEAKTV